MLIQVSNEEHTQILAGLRLWQADTGSRNKKTIEESIILDNDMPGLGDEAIDDLCERINQESIPDKLYVLTIVQTLRSKDRKPKLVTSIHSTLNEAREGLDKYIAANWKKHITGELVKGELTPGDRLAIYFNSSWDKPNAVESETWHISEVQFS